MRPRRVWTEWTRVREPREIGCAVDGFPEIYSAKDFEYTGRRSGESSSNYAMHEASLLAGSDGGSEPWKKMGGWIGGSSAWKMHPYSYRLEKEKAHHD